MRTTLKSLAPAAAAACLSLLAARAASAAAIEVCLRVDPYEIPGSPGAAGPFDNEAPIPMWGFVLTGVGPGCDFGAPGPGAGAAEAVIPTLTAVAGDTLDIHLRNGLPAPGPAYTEPVSIIIPGQTSIVPGQSPPAPVTTAVWFSPVTGVVTSASRPLDPGGGVDFLARVRSFAEETPQGGTTTVTYAFGPLRAGTYLIQSGTHPSVQMQMGLYGILKVYDLNAQAYADPWTAFDSEATLLFSEIDPALHDAVAAGQYGPGGQVTSTIDYHPRYFLVNGRPYTAAAASVPIGTNNSKVLLRLLNAGLETKVPVLQGRHAAIVAEDGHLLLASGFTGSPPVAATCPARRLQYSVPLPAGKTVDAILTTPPAPVTIPVYDRRLSLTNAGVSPGGMLVNLTTAPGGPPSAPAPPPACTLTGAGP